MYHKAPDFAWTSPFTVYLRTILLNLARDELRRLRQSRLRLESLDPDGPEPVDPSPRLSPEAALLARERDATVDRALAQLAPVDRLILRECLIEDRSGQELAQALGMSRDALYQRLHRARRKLKTLLATEGGMSDR